MGGTAENKTRGPGTRLFSAGLGPGTGTRTWTGNLGQDQDQDPGTGTRLILCCGGGLGVKEGFCARQRNHTTLFETRGRGGKAPPFHQADAGHIHFSHFKVKLLMQAPPTDPRTMPAIRMKAQVPCGQQQKMQKGNLMTGPYRKRTRAVL